MSDLFPYPLLSWLPDETLFSFVSRCHHLWGHQAPWRTSEILFGNRRGGYQHDLPNRVTEFVRRTQGSVGDVDAIIREHTLLRYYLPFLSTTEADHHASTMSGPSVAHLKFRLGLLTSRFRANHPLKACIDCMAFDLKEYGWTYWHLAHQYPGVWMCVRHQQLLREFQFKSNGVGRFQWYLPEETMLAPAAAMPGDVRRSIFSLSETVCNVIAWAAPASLSERSVQAVLLKAFDSRGWLTDSGRLYLAQASPAFLSHVTPLRECAEFSALPISETEAASQLGRLLRPMRTGTHPLRYLVMVNWLYGEGGGFLAACEGAGEHLPLASSDAGERVLPMPPIDRRQERIPELLVEKGMSARAAASMLDVDTATVIAWAAKQGIPTTRRPKYLKGDRYEALLTDIRAGIDKSVAANRHGVSIETVTRMLRSVSGLRDCWQDARLTAARDSAREEWGRLAESHGHLGIKLMRAMAPSSYAWLYRNDREWLRACAVPTRVSRSLAVPSRVQWDERDLALQGSILAAANALAGNGIRRIRLGDLCQRIPELRPKLSALDRLPLTRQAIERALAYRPDNTRQLF